MQEGEGVANVEQPMAAGFDDKGFFRALDARRQLLGTTWRAVARELDVSPSTFSRLARGRRPDVDTFAKLVRWLGLPAERFFTGTAERRVGAGDTVAALMMALQSDPTLSREDAATLEQIFRVAYTRLRRTPS